MIYSDVENELRNRIDELYSRGTSYRAMGKMAGVSHTTIENVHKRITRPTLENLVKMVTGLGMDRHKAAHITFGLPSPEEPDFYELDELLKDICDRVMAMDQDDRKNVLTYIKTLARMREEEEGGDAKNEAQNAQAGYG